VKITRFAEKSNKNVFQDTKVYTFNCPQDTFYTFNCPQNAVTHTAMNRSAK
jgi:hypothetical protein